MWDRPETDRWADPPEPREPACETCDDTGCDDCPRCGYCGDLLSKGDHRRCREIDT